MYDAGVPQSKVSVITSGLHEVRQVFDLMDTDGDDAWARVDARLAAIPETLAGYRATLLRSADAGHVSARRQPDRGGRAGPVLDRAERLGGRRDRRVLRRLVRGSAPTAPCGRSSSGTRRRRPRPSPSSAGSSRPTWPPAAGPRRSAGPLCAGLPLLPGRHRGPRGDLPLGLGGAPTDRGRHGRGRPPDRALGLGRRGGRRPRPAGGRSPARTPRLDAAARRPSPRWPTSTSSQARYADRVLHRPDRRRRHLLHRAERGLHPSGPDVVGGPRGHRRVLHLARGDHGLPRGRPRPSPAGRADRLPDRAAQPLAAADVLGLGPRRGAGRCTPSG